MEFKRKRIIALIPVFLLLFSLTGCASNTVKIEKPEVKNGLIMLSGWDFSKDGNVALDGKWAFYWNEILQPGEFGNKMPIGYYKLPSGWAKYTELHLPSHGIATYRLIVKTEATTGLYGIFIPNVYTEYALWINGLLIHACGSFAQDGTVYLHPQVYDFYLADTELEIVLQVKNDALIYGGGVGQSIRFGTSEQIRKEYNTYAAIDLLLISICAFAGFFFLVLYYFRKNSRELVGLSALCLSVSLRNMLSNTTLIMQVFPHLPFWLGSRLIMLTIPIIIISMLFYTRQLYRDEMPPMAFRIILSLNALYVFTLLFLSSTIYSAAFTPFLLVVGAACALGIYVSVKTMKRRKKESAFFMAGMMLLAMGAVFDSLVYLGVLSIRYILSGTLFGFIVIQMILLAKRYSETFRHAELLSVNLQASLDKIMYTETAYMSAQMKPHFLYNALTTIAENCEVNPKEAGNLIISLSKYLRQTLDYDNLSGIVPLKKELELVRAYTTIEKARFSNIEVIFDLPEPLPELRLPPLTLQPLVENAIKHGLRKKKLGGRVTISAEIKENSVLFCVEDNGAGITENIMQTLGDLPNGSVSIGLYNINTRLKRIFGAGLDIQSEYGVGTSVRFLIPFKEEN